MFHHWNGEEQNVPFFRVVLELGLSRANKKPSFIPMKKAADLVEVEITPVLSAPTEDGEAMFENKPSTVYKTKSDSVKEEKVKFLRLRGIAGVRWMNGDTYDCFTKLLEGPFEAKTMSSMSDGVASVCSWSVFHGL